MSCRRITERTGGMLVAGTLLAEPDHVNDIAYVSETTIERIDGPIRSARLPGNDAPTYYGVHGAIAAHYGVPEGKFPTHATTIDHVIAAAGG